MGKHKQQNEDMYGDVLFVMYLFILGLLFMIIRC